VLPPSDDRDDRPLRRRLERRIALLVAERLLAEEQGEAAGHLELGGREPERIDLPGQRSHLFSAVAQAAGEAAVAEEQCGHHTELRPRRLRDAAGHLHRFGLQRRPIAVGQRREAGEGRGVRPQVRSHRAAQRERLLGDLVQPGAVAPDEGDGRLGIQQLEAIDLAVDEPKLPDPPKHTLRLGHIAALHGRRDQISEYLPPRPLVSTCLGLDQRRTERLRIE